MKNTIPSKQQNNESASQLMSSPSQFPPVGELFSKSFEIVRKTWYKQLGIGLIFDGILVASFFLALAAIFGSNFSQLGGLVQLARNKELTLASIPQSLWTNITIVTIIWWIATSFVLSALGSVLIILVHNEYLKQHISVGQIWKIGWGKVIPLFFLGVLTSVLAIGGYWLFVIPGIAISYLLAYANFEVVIKNNSLRNAMRESIRINLAHFWSILGRICLFTIVFLVTYGVVMLFKWQLELLHLPVFSYLLSLAYQLVLPWFGMAYAVVLYNQASEASVTAPARSLKTITILSLLGWLLAGLVCFTVVSYVKSHWSEIGAALQKNLQTQKNAASLLLENSSDSWSGATVPSDCGISLPLPQSTDSKDGKDRKWYFEERAIASSDFPPLEQTAYARKSVLLTLLSYKRADQKLPTSGSYNIGFPGINVYCIENPRKLALSEYKGLVLANSSLKVENVGTRQYGDLQTEQFVFTGKENGKEFDDRGQIAVSKDGNRLIYFRIWGVSKDDPVYDQIQKDTDNILQGITSRDTQTQLVLPTTPASRQNSSGDSSSGSCTSLNIREGKFASNKCYSKKNYDDLTYYLQRYDSAAATYNGAVASMSITCSGSDFFKNQCEQDKQQKQQSETNLSNYEAKIRALIATGK